MNSEEKRFTILIVDDEPHNIKVLTELLKDDYKIIATKTGEKALQVFQGDLLPDLVLLDVMMPGIDGYEICRQLKNDKRSMDTPVIFITTLSEENDEVRGFQLGAVDFIIKPFEPLVVKSRVKTHTMLRHKEKLLEKIVGLDGLTEIPNRRAFDENLTNGWERAVRRKEPLSLAMLDVDFFKQYNDNYGHAAGDDCLREISIVLKDCLKRASDYVARYGGEEFALILPQTDQSRALEYVEGIRRSILARKIPHDYSVVSNYVSVSIGVASIVPTKDKNPAVLVEAADRCLYKAKEQGRNQVFGEMYKEV